MSAISEVTTNFVLFCNFFTHHNVAEGLRLEFLSCHCCSFSISVHCSFHIVPHKCIFFLSFETHGVSLSNLAGSVLSELDTLQFFTKDVTPAMLFPTIHDAVLSCQQSRCVTTASASELLEA